MGCLEWHGEGLDIQQKKEESVQFGQGMFEDMLKIDSQTLH